MSVELSYSQRRAMDVVVEGALDDLDVEECAIEDVVARAIEDDDEIRRLVRAREDCYDVSERREDELDDVGGPAFDAAETLRDAIDARVEEVVDEAIAATRRSTTATSTEGSA